MLYDIKSKAKQFLCHNVYVMQQINLALGG